MRPPPLSSQLPANGPTAHGEQELLEEAGPPPRAGRMVEEVTSPGLVTADSTGVRVTGYDHGCCAARRRPPAGAAGAGDQGAAGRQLLGVHWMHTFTSGLLGGVGDDAAELVGQMTGRTA